MQPRSEPLLWLQCLALGAIPLELLLIRLVLAGADPGPVPGVERVLIWGVGVLAPAVALWRRPADWGSLLLVRQPLASRSSDQLRISASPWRPEQPRRRGDGSCHPAARPLVAGRFSGARE